MKKMLETKVTYWVPSIKLQTPKIMTAMAILSTVPTLYYLYNILGYDYEDKELYESVKRESIGSIMWISFQYFLHNNFSFSQAGIYLGLEAIKYSDRRAKVRPGATRNT